MNFQGQFQGLFLSGRKKWVIVVVIVAFTHLLCQSLLLPYGNALRSLLPIDEDSIQGKDRLSFSNSDVELTMIKVGEDFKLGEVDYKETTEKVDSNLNSVTLNVEVLDTDPILAKDTNVGHRFPLNKKMEDGEIQDNNFELTKIGESRHGLSLKETNTSTIVMETSVQDAETTGRIPSPLVRSVEVNASIDITAAVNLTSNVRTSNGPTSNSTLSEEQFEELPDDANHIMLPSESLSNVSTKISKFFRKKMKSEMPPQSVTSINQMNLLLVRHRRSSRAMVQNVRVR